MKRDGMTRTLVARSPPRSRSPRRRRPIPTAGEADRAVPPGSATDLAARVVGAAAAGSAQAAVHRGEQARRAGLDRRQRGGAGAAPDGYTLLLTAEHARSACQRDAVQEDALRPGEGLCAGGAHRRDPLVLMVSPTSPPKTSRNSRLRAGKPGKMLAPGSARRARRPQLAMLEQAGRAGRASVPYKGIPLAVNDVIGGTLDFTFVDLGNALAQAKGGKLEGPRRDSAKRNAARARLAGDRRGAAGYELIAWFALMAPAGTPPQIWRSGCTTSRSRGSLERGGEG